jgi:hypothetical protein
VDLVDPNGAYTSIAIDSAGNPWIAYASGDLKIARYVGGGSGNGCSNSDWTCTAMESSSNLGQYSSIAFDSYGRPVVSYYNATGADLRIAKLDDRAGELLISPASGGRWGDSLSESHADMSSVSDTGNRDDADCIGGGTWTNGMLALSENVTQALTDAHCTGLTITIDTSQAVVGRTYRIILASNDNWRQDKGMWRGFSSYDQYATITISDSVMRAGKDNTPQFSNCTDTAWGCMTVKSSASDIGKYSSMAIDSEGRPWIAYLDSTNFNVEVSHYVGSGGTGCATSAWECTVVGTDASGPISIVIDSQDSPWLTYFNEAGGDIFSQSLRVYQYTGGSWSVKMDEPATNIVDAQLTFDQKGNPRLLYTDAGSGNITVAHYVGSGGSGCVASPAWTCVTVAVVSAGLGSFASITLDAAGIPWVSYTDGSSKTLSIAHYVGFGGTGCNVSSWTCASVDTSGSVGGYPSIAIDSSDKPWISYYDSSSFDLKVANYIGSGGNCGSGAWNCVSVYTSGIAGTYTSIAMDSIGNPWVSFRGAGLLVARYVTSGGNCGSGAWTCSTVDSTGGVGTYDKIAFDSTGSAWISYYDSTNSDLKVAKTHRPVTPISLNNLYRSRTNNAGQSFARHKLSPGASPNDSSGSCGSSISDYMGVCAWFQNNGQYDTVVAQANEAPTLTMAMRFNDNSKLPTIQWFGRSSYAPNTAGTAGDIVLEVYRYGSTNAWETVASDTSSSDCSAPSAGNCGLSGIPSGTPSDYFYNDGAGGYWVYCRLYQEPNTGGTITFKTDEFNAVRTESRLRHGQFFQDGVSRPLNWR